jgi:hypothetical protein
VFIDSYPAAKRELDLAALDLCPFLPGALVYTTDGLATVADPLRRPQDVWKGLAAPVGSLGDKLRLGLYRLAGGSWDAREVLARPETTTRHHLSEKLGLSDAVIDRFFAPFYRGIFLAPLHEQSSACFEFVFAMLARGNACLPAAGMQAVPNQLAAKFSAHCAALDAEEALALAATVAAAAAAVALPAGFAEPPRVERLDRVGRRRGLRLGTAVLQLRGGQPAVTALPVAKAAPSGAAAAGGAGWVLAVAGGGEVACDYVVVATEGPAAARLVLQADATRADAASTGPAAERALVAGGGSDLESSSPSLVAAAARMAAPGRSSTCLYFAFEGPPPVADPVRRWCLHLRCWRFIGWPSLSLQL